MQNIWGVFDLSIYGPDRFECAFLYKENAEKYVEDQVEKIRGCKKSDFIIQEIILEDVKGV